MHKLRPGQEQLDKRFRFLDCNASPGRSRLFWNGANLVNDEVRDVQSNLAIECGLNTCSGRTDWVHQGLSEDVAVKNYLAHGFTRQKACRGGRHGPCASLLPDVRQVPRPSCSCA